VVNVAVQKAVVLPDPTVGMHVAAVERFVAPLLN
jgi:hypothetical protein